ncbi:lipase 3 isoform X2 [Solenopsis invicta]|uniref:lipase 3 isoform X2 n=1 Tax=Solenopsis invicta TaxID=13686 RepID=UPI00193E6880|nr:lipase 3 isoform X2 [Solenopsis invicta]
MKLILLSLMLVTFSEGKSRFSQDMSFLQNQFLNILFPKDPGIVKVRRMNPTEGIMSNAVLDFIGMVEQYGYPAEEHNVTTEDGYNLKIHRMPGSPLLDNNIKKKVVFLQHGLFASSDSWVWYGPGKDLAFLLVDQGYDVWIGNMRGNTYCRSHVNMTIYDRKFWQYSYHEVGTKDLPAMLDYILNYRGEKDLYYIGHSMGTTSIFALLSTRPEYNVKIKMAILMAPVAIWLKTLPTIYALVGVVSILKPFLEKNKIYDLFPQSLATLMLARLCKDNTATQIICINLVFAFAGPDPEQLNTTTLPELISHFPAGSSLQAVQHYYQNMGTKDFRQYDYGEDENYRRYQQKTPPLYDFKKITAPIVLSYSDNDYLVAVENFIRRFAVFQQCN